MNRSTRLNIIYVLIAAVGVFFLHNLWARSSTVESLAYSEFQQLVKDGKVKEIVISSGEIRGELKAPKDGQKRYFRATRVDSALARDLAEHKVKFSGQVESQLFATLLSWMIPIALFVGIWLLVVRRLASKMGGGGGLMSIGKSKAKVYVETDTKTTFEHVAGVESQLVEWMTEHEYTSVRQLQGSVSYKTSADRSSYERSQYIRTLSSYLLDHALGSTH